MSSMNCLHKHQRHKQSSQTARRRTEVLGKHDPAKAVVLEKDSALLGTLTADDVQAKSSTRLPASAGVEWDPHGRGRTACFVLLVQIELGAKI